MSDLRWMTAVFASLATLGVLLFAVTGEGQSGAAAADDCGPGARSLSRPGEVLFPETGNGGYRSVHTDVRLVYRPRSNRFLSGTEVDLELKAEHCLTEFSLDFETGGRGKRRGGPHLKLGAVSVNGSSATVRFARPAYPGNPGGPDDPDPRTHQMGQQNPVGGPKHNPLPPACSPMLGPRQKLHARDGDLCPATKLVIRPDSPIPAGEMFRARIGYTGRPGLHRGANGTKDGWWRAPGGAVTITEPLGTQAWMPLNNHPSAKPTYDFRIRTARDRTVIANGEFRSRIRNAPDRPFPRGSTTSHWNSPDPIGSYLPLVVIGRYFKKKIRRGGVTYRLLQDRTIPGSERHRFARGLAKLPESTRFLRRWNGPFPFSTNGAAVTIPSQDDMEMQTLTLFGGGGMDVSTLFHENQHQWWGNNVGQATYGMVWFKEGLATFAEILRRARINRHLKGRPGAFRRSLINQFGRTYRRPQGFWTQAPSHPRPARYFSGASTYERPGAAYTALYLTLGFSRFRDALRELRSHEGGTVIRAGWEEAFTDQAPNSRCRRSLDRFFSQWLDTRFPRKGKRRPVLTGPGLHGRTPPGC